MSKHPPEYDIPLGTIYEDGAGPRVEIKAGIGGPKFCVVDRTGDVPHDLVELADSEVEELAHVALAYLNRDRDGTLGLSRTGTEFGVYRTDVDDDIDEDEVGDVRDTEHTEDDDE